MSQVQILSPPPTLKGDSMDDWKREYKKALLAAFVKAADVRSEKRSYYSTGGGFDYQMTGDVHQHFEQCNVDTYLTAMPDDSEWSEFMGTFYEGDNTAYGMDAEITCTCGIYKQIDMRYTGTFSDLLQAILREDQHA